MLKRPVLLMGMLLMTIAVSMFVANGIANSQSKSKSSKKEEAKTSEGEEVKGRLPRYYGQLELKEEQVTEIYKLQFSYREKIQELEDQLAALREEMNDECEKVLTSTQKKILADLRGGTGEKEDKEEVAKSKTSSKKKSSSTKKGAEQKEKDSE